MHERVGGDIVPDDFWEDIDHYVHHPMGSELSDALTRRRRGRHAKSDPIGLDASAVIPPPETVSRKEHPDRPSVAARDEATSTPVAATGESAATPLLPPATPEDGGNRPQTGRASVLDLNRDEAEHVKTRYIVGKRAGKDLFDQQGQLIIRKDEVITAEIVAVVEYNGKLVELILNMVIDDFGG